MKALAAVVALLIALPAFAQDRVIVEQENAPVVLSNYSADIGGPRGQPPALVHGVRFESKSDQHIVAVQVGFLAFDVLNEFMEHAVATTVNGGRPSTSGLVAATMDTDDRDAFYSGMVYVRGVRYADGQIWKADLGPVVATARRIDGQVKADHLSR